jgi:hypothetical protein
MRGVITPLHLTFTVACFVIKHPLYLYRRIVLRWVGVLRKLLAQGFLEKSRRETTLG